MNKEKAKLIMLINDEELWSVADLLPTLTLKHIVFNAYGELREQNEIVALLNREIQKRFHI